MPSYCFLGAIYDTAANALTQLKRLQYIAIDRIQKGIDAVKAGTYIQEIENIINASITTLETTAKAIETDWGSDPTFQSLFKAAESTVIANQDKIAALTAELVALRNQSGGYSSTPGSVDPITGIEYSKTLLQKYGVLPSAPSAPSATSAPTTDAGTTAPGVPGADTQLTTGTTSDKPMIPNWAWIAIGGLVFLGLNK